MCAPFNESQGQVSELQEFKTTAETQISSLQTENTTLEEQIAGLLAYKTSAETQITEMRDQLQILRSKVDYSDSAFNYLAIGNSITKHGLAEYWWNEIGMAASTEGNDYVHLVADHLMTVHGEVCFHAMNYYRWESQAHDRAETFEFLDPYLDPRLNLITIQLSENVTDLTTFEGDYEELIRYIQKKVPQAQIIVIDDFWDAGERAQAKQLAAENTGVQFIFLGEIKGLPEYKAGLGTVVYDANGEPHTIEHNGVAGHPGDKGMRYIADAVIAALEDGQ